MRPAIEMKDAGAHPIRRGGHAVGEGTHAAAGHVKFTGGFRAGPDRDADVQREGDADDEVGPRFDVHLDVLLFFGFRRILFVEAVLLVELVHQADVYKNQHDEDINGALLSHPEAELKTAE